MRLKGKAVAGGAAGEDSANDGTGPFRYIPPHDEPQGVVECEESKDVVESEWADVLAYLSCGKAEEKPK